MALQTDREDTTALQKGIWDEKLKFFQDQDFNINCLVQGAVYEYASEVRFDYYYRSIPGSNSISRKLGEPKNFDCHLYFIDKLSLLPTSLIKGNSWAIRRRIVHIYKLLTSPSQKEQIIKMLSDNDRIFCLLLKFSNKLYCLLHACGLNEKYSFIVSFPYYSIYNKIYNTLVRYKTKKVLFE